MPQPTSRHALRTLATVSTLALAAALPGQAGAQEFSFGTALEFGEGDFVQQPLFGTPNAFSEGYRVFRLEGQVSYPIGTDGAYFGGDVSLGFSVGGTGFAGDPNGELYQFHRARMVGGYRTGNLDIYAAFGYAVAKGKFFPGSPWEASTFEGRTGALGLGYQINDRLALNAEMIRDDLETTDGQKTTTWDNRALSAGATYKF